MKNFFSCIFALFPPLPRTTHKIKDSFEGHRMILFLFFFGFIVCCNSQYASPQNRRGTIRDGLGVWNALRETWNVWIAAGKWAWDSVWRHFLVTSLPLKQESRPFVLKIHWNFPKTVKIEPNSASEDIFRPFRHPYGKNQSLVAVIYWNFPQTCQKKWRLSFRWHFLAFSLLPEPLSTI